MRHFLSACIALIALAGCTDKTVTLMSYNIRHGWGLDDITDYNRIGKMIKSHNPDVVAIQEVDSATTRSNGNYVLGEIAKAAGMHDYFAPAINYDGGKYGIGLLCREEPLEVRRFSLPGSEEQRALIIAEFDNYVYACTHLSLTEEDRNASAAIITDIAKKYDKPFFIAGDFNAQPTDPFYATFTKNFIPLTDTTGKHPTFPADTPKVVIDYIMQMIPTSGEYTISSIDPEVINEPSMSDHRPIIVRTTLP